MKWTPYQKAWLRDTAQQKAYVKSRRIGISEVVAFEIACEAVGIDMMCVPPRPVKPVPQAIVSAGEVQAKDLLKKVMRHIRVLGMAATAPLVTIDNATSATLGNGIEIRAFSSNPRSIRGFEGSWTWDECAATPRPYEVFKALGPLADANLRNAHGYNKRIVFTPEGDDNLAYDVAKGRLKEQWSLHSTTIHEAVADGFPIDVEAKREAVGDPEMFGQEYECEFLSASMRYISAELYDSTIFQELPDTQGIATPRYAGYDIARHRDLIADVELMDYKGALWADRVDTARDVAWDDQEAWLSEIMGRCARVHADATGMGDQFCERAENTYGARFQGVQFTLANKARLATGIKLAMERKCRFGGSFLRLPNDVGLRRAVLAIRRDITQHGNVTYNAPRDPKHGHADEAWALGLAIDAAGGVATVPLTMPKETLVKTPGRTRLFEHRARRPI